MRRRIRSIELRKSSNVFCSSGKDISLNVVLEGRRKQSHRPILHIQSYGTHCLVYQIPGFKYWEQGLNEGLT